MSICESTEQLETCKNDDPILTQSENQTSETPVAPLDSTQKPLILAASNLSGKKRKLTSSVWEHFEKVRRNNEDCAICNYCKTCLKANSKNGTKSLHNHVEKCSRRKNQSLSQCFERQKKISVDKGSDGKVQFANFTFDQEISRKELACAIIMHEYPLSIVDHSRFRRFCNSLQPLFKMVSRNTIKKDIFNIYDCEFQRLYKELAKLKSRIAITTDMWTSNQKKGYMSVTAHFIDDTWALQSRILRFVYVPTPHTKEELARHLMDALTKWNIETKISTITVDNCAANDGMISIIVDKLFGDLVNGGKILHMRCCAHILNLAVKDGLSIINDALIRIRESVAFWSSTPQRVEKFDEMAKQLHVNCSKKLSLDCKTRWNSTYLMLQTALEYKDVFPRLRIREKHYTNVPTEEDWCIAGKIAESLEIFYITTELFSGRNYPTSNCFFISICQIRNRLVEWMSSSDEVISKMAMKMFEKFEKYWSVVHIVLSMAVILDPRYKMKVIEYYYPMIYGESSTYEISEVKDTCYRLLNEYQSKASKHNQSHLNYEVQQVSLCENSQKLDMINLVAFLTSSSSDIHVKSELDHYLEEPILPWTLEFDILNWWKTNGLKYPTLQMIARDFLAVPVSTVSSESAFSTGGRVVNDQRSKLHENTLEALMCSQNWLMSYEDSSASSSCINTIEEDDD